MNGGRRRAFNKGKWQVERERLRMASHKPPAGLSESSPIGAVVATLMKRFGMEESHLLETVAEEWERLVGADVARHSRPAGLQGKVLAIYVDSSVWLSELSRYGRDKILANIRARFGADAIRNLRFQLDPDK